MISFYRMPTARAGARSGPAYLTGFRLRIDAAHCEARLAWASRLTSGVFPAEHRWR
ncbi:hypothetical protein XHV734_0712 [Xanthomonas hortorum pv. vitians]|nr:hypothetical protein XHV734_0712 [Xanthomonas hortorum pv. vitians]